MKQKHVELGLFMDNESYTKFSEVLEHDEILETILAFVNQLVAIYSLPSLGETVDFSIAHLHIDNGTAPLYENHGGERIKLLGSFCE